VGRVQIIDWVCIEFSTKTNYPLGMSGNVEGKKWIIIIWIWERTKVDLSIPSPVTDLHRG
jgi:hypothetical protein